MTRLPAQQRREQLLAAAASLFAKHGYAGATTSGLAKAAGVTEPIIYRHFTSKKDLFIAVIQNAGRETIRVWEEQLNGASDPAQRLRRLIAANPMTYSQGRGIYRVIVQAMTEIEDPDILAALKDHVEALHRFVAAEVQRAQELGHVSKAFSPDITAWTLIHLGIGFGVLAPLGIKNHAIDDHGVRVRHLVMKLMFGDRAKQLQDEYARREQAREHPADPNHD